MFYFNFNVKEVILIWYKNFVNWYINLYVEIVKFYFLCLRYILFELCLDRVKFYLNKRINCGFFLVMYWLKIIKYNINFLFYYLYKLLMLKMYIDVSISEW